MINILRAYQQNYLNNMKINYKRYFHNIVDFDNKLIGIIGARGVGKTIFLLQYLKESPFEFHQKLYFSADVIDIDSIFDIAYEFHKVGGKLLIIDEIHKYNNFEIELKKIYDMLDLKVIFSGSSAIKLDNSKGDLSRRAIMYNMNGLSFREFIELKEGIELPYFTLEDILNNHINISATILSQIKPYQYWNEYLKYGFYPFYFENQNSYPIRLKETINTVIEVDIPSIFKIEYEKIINLKKLVRLVCQSKPFEINIRELSSKIGIGDYQTLYKYLEYLKRGKILNILKPLSKGDNIFSKPDKIYLSNPNLHFSYCNNSEIGTIREVFFASQFHEDRLHSIKRGDFLLDGKYTFEIGGKNKGFKQIKDIENSYVVRDDIEIGDKNILPLWLFGFLY
ncbi:MAG: AAA family ATPase [Sulfurovum sp.]